MTFWTYSRKQCNVPLTQVGSPKRVWSRGFKVTAKEYKEQYISNWSVMRQCYQFAHCLMIKSVFIGVIKHLNEIEITVLLAVLYYI